MHAVSTTRRTTLTGCRIALRSASMSSLASNTSTNTVSSPTAAAADTQVQKHSPAQQVSQLRGWAREVVVRMGVGMAVGTGAQEAGAPVTAMSTHATDRANPDPMVRP